MRFFLRNLSRIESITQRYLSIKLLFLLVVNNVLDDRVHTELEFVDLCENPIILIMVIQLVVRALRFNLLLSVEQLKEALTVSVVCLNAGIPGGLSERA